MVNIINKYLEEIVANKPNFKEYHLNMLSELPPLALTG